MVDTAISDLPAGTAAPADELAASDTSNPGNSIKLTAGAIADVNTESGTWVPQLEDLSSNQAAMNSSSDGTYRKMGPLVFITCNVETTDIAGLIGSIRVKGLPFPVVGDNTSIVPSETFSLLIPASGGVSATLSGFCFVGSDTFRIELWDDSGGSSPMTPAQWSSNGRCHFAFFYFTT